MLQIIKVIRKLKQQQENSLKSLKILFLDSNLLI